MTAGGERTGMNGTFIKLYRDLLDSAVFAHEGLLQTWIWCLLKASYKSRTVPVKTGRGQTLVELKPGQFIYGRKTAANALETPGTTVHGRMQKLD